MLNPEAIDVVEPDAATAAPIAPFGNGRDAGGRFGRGNAGGPGNPYARQVAELRAAIMRAVSAADIEAIVAKLVEQAKDGNLPAARELFERTLGKPVEADLIARTEALEAKLGALHEQKGGR